jgi:putative nucleotidyltransferase with HDIG domain
MSPSSPVLLRREAVAEPGTVDGGLAERGARGAGTHRPPPGEPAPEQRVPAAVTAPWHEQRPGVLRYLPVALLATFTVAVLPAIATSALLRGHGLAGSVAAICCAVALSLLIAAVESTAWQRLHGARGVVFADLMLWSLLRRLWAERRLGQIEAAYRTAASGQRLVRTDLLADLSRLLEIRNPYTYGHCRRVARHAERIARAMSLAPAEIAEIRTAALIHDIGKLYTPERILHKAGSLSEEEFDVLKRHSADGAAMVAPVRDARLAAIVRHHHERLDGSGYPDGLRGAKIPLGARVVAVADTFDAITSDRPYRRARSQREGLAVLAAEAGTMLDAAAVEAFLADYTPRRLLASVSLSTAVSARLGALQLLPGGLLGGASLAGVLPAVGAAGLLALAPGARYERPSTQRGAATGALAPASRLVSPGVPGRGPGGLPSRLPRTAPAARGPARRAPQRRRAGQASGTRPGGSTAPIEPSPQRPAGEGRGGEPLALPAAPLPTVRAGGGEVALPVRPEAGAPTAPTLPASPVQTPATVPTITLPPPGAGVTGVSPQTVTVPSQSLLASGSGGAGSGASLP